MMEYDVSLVKCETYDESTAKDMLVKVLEPIGGLDFVKEGMTVVIKANLVCAMAPEKAATTHPVLLGALTELIIEKGAKVIVGDSPGGIYNSIYVNRIYSATGMKELEKRGAELNQDFSQKTVKNPEGKVLKELTYTGYLDKADVIIDFCKLKSHGMMGMSAAAKNMFGAVPGTIKPEYHFKYPDYGDFANMIVDINEYFKPYIAIADAVTGMEGNGPTAGTPKHMGFIGASKSAHKLDVVCAELLGLAPDSVPTIIAARGRGLVPIDIDQLLINEDIDEFRVPDFKHSASRTSIVFSGDGRNSLMRLVSKILGAILTSRPKLKKSECVGCAVCAGICPAKAIEMVDKKPIIDKEKCIRCFCCQEFCPKGAMKVHRTLLARIAGKI